MTRASTIAITALAAGVVAAVLGLWIAVHRAPEPVVVSAPPPPPAPAPAAHPEHTALVAPQPATPPEPAEPEPPPAKPPSPELAAYQDQVRANAREGREKALTTLQDSGVASESWAPRATAVINEVGRHATSTTPAGCFVAGCAATFTFASQMDYLHALADINASDEYKAWTGGKHWTMPETAPDGTVTMALLLYRPD
jgi:hypothetical protein